MLKISKMADYATLVMIYCGEHRAQAWSAAEIAQKTQLQLPTVSKLLKKLLKAGLLTSHRGVHGGYQLAIEPDKISIAFIIKAIDGPIAVTECNHATKLCELEQHCVSRKGWQLINQTVEQALSKVSLIDMMATPFSTNHNAARGKPALALKREESQFSPLKNHPIA